MALLENVINAPTPYIAKIPGGNLIPGKQIIVQGSVPLNCEFFEVNLVTDNVAEGNTRSVTPFHFNPRFNEKCVVRNCLKNGGWGDEERYGGMPFANGTPFEIKIQCELNTFEVIINGSHFCDFQHRLPLADVSTIAIEGDVVVKAVQFFEAHPVPPPHMGYPPAPPVTKMMYPVSFPATMNMLLYNPDIPLTTGIPNGLHHGKMIFISGTPTAASKFSVNLYEYRLDNPDIGFHVGVRFNAHGCVNTVARNHRSNGVWGKEERSAPYFPFIPNTPFEMIILCENTGFKVAVNNQHFIEFRHRLVPFAKFSMLGISLDVRITQVRFQ